MDSQTWNSTCGLLPSLLFTHIEMLFPQLQLALQLTTGSNKPLWRWINFSMYYYVN